MLASAPMLRRALLASCLGAAIACASSPPAPMPRPPAPAPTAAPDVPEPQPDLSPVAEPKSIVLVMRASPELLATLAFEPELAKLAARPLDVLAPELPSGLNELWTRGPLELAVAVDAPETILMRGADVVGSLPLASFESTLAFLRERERHEELALERRSPGVVAITPRGAAQATCLLSVARGPAPARLVCANRPGALDTLAPYMARGLPERDLGPEPLVVESFPARFAREHREKLASLLRFVAPPAGRRWTDAALSTLADDGVDLAADLARVRLGVAQQSGGITAELALELDGNRAWLSRTVRALPPVPRGPRELFERLPADTEAAWFFTAAEPARSDEARAAFTGWLSSELGKAVSRETLELVAKTFIQRVPHLYAHGDAFGRDVGYGRFTGKSLWEKTRSTYGWHLIGFDAPLKGFVPELDKGMRAYNSGPLHDFAYRTLPRLCRGLPKIKKRPAPRGLPPGSVLYELPLPGKFFDDCMRGRAVPPEPAPNDAIVVVAMPVGERTFIGFGLSEPDMLARMRGLTRAEGRLSKAGLALLEGPDVRFGGFTSLAGFGGIVRFVSMTEHWDFERRRLGALPNRGRTPVPFALSTERSGSRVVAKLELPAALLADLAAR